METTSDNIKKDNTPPTQNKGRLSGWLNKAFGKAENDIRQPDVKQTHNESKQEKEIREGKEELRKFIDEFKSQTSLNVDAHNLTNAIHNFQYYEAKLFENQGYLDGVKGVKDNNIESSAQVKADFIFEHTNSILAGRLEGIKTKLGFKNTQVNGIEDELEYEKEFNGDINFLNKKEHRHFSKSLATFYIIVGIAMMFADFPISLSISKYFIDLPIEFEETFWNNITNPEILLFSLGITFLSIYYKIIYDEYINTSILPERLRNEEKIIKSIWSKVFAGIRLIIKLTILCFLLYLLYNIGNLRNALNPLDIKPRYPDLVSQKEIFDYKLISFIGTTILLPMLSGICLSLGFNIYSNNDNLKISNLKLKRLSDDKNAIEIEKTDTEIIKNMLDSLKKEWGNRDHKIVGIKQLFVNSYYQGFKRGRKTKYGLDLYDNASSLYIDYINSQN